MINYDGLKEKVTVEGVTVAGVKYEAGQMVTEDAYKKVKTKRDNLVSKVAKGRKLSHVQQRNYVEVTELLLSILIHNRFQLFTVTHWYEEDKTRLAGKEKRYNDLLANQAEIEDWEEDIVDKNTLIELSFLQDMKVFTFGYKGLGQL